MNIFVCDPSPVRAAQDLADKHLVKMVLETAQLLSTITSLKGLTFKDQYRITHRNHPCVIALCDNPDYLEWTIIHGIALGVEYQSRFNRFHKSLNIVYDARNALVTAELTNPDLRIAYTEQEIETFPKAVLDEYKHLPVIEAYRSHLRHKYLSLWKPNQLRWTPPGTQPKWL